MTLLPSLARTGAAFAALTLMAQEADLGERLYHSGERAFAAKGYAEALDSWGQVVQQAPRSKWAALALLRMAQYHAGPGRTPEAALPLLDQLRTEHLQSPAAAEGLLLRGTLLAARARRPQELREAMAEFNRVADLFPDRPEVAEAKLRLGQAFLDQGLLAKALAAFAEAAGRDPEAPGAPRALLLAGETLDQMGDLEGCLALHQRLLLQHAQSPEASEARWRIAVRVKHRLQRPPLRSTGAWPQGRTKWLKTPTLLATGTEGELFIYQDDLDRAFRLNGSVLEPSGPSGKNAKAMLIGPGGQPWLLVPKTGALREDGSTLPLPTLGQPSGGFVDRWGTLWVADAKAPNLGLVSPEGALRPLPAPAASGLAPMPGQGAVLASDANRSLIYLGANGATRLSVPYGRELPAAFRAVVALASDPLGHVAALVEGGDFEGLVVWGPDGALLRQATLKSLGLSGRFKALAFDRQGGLVLADRTNDLLVRIE